MSTGEKEERGEAVSLPFHPVAAIFAVLATGSGADPPVPPSGGGERGSDVH